MANNRPEPILETRLPKENLDFPALMAKARDQHQRGFYAQAFEILRLAFGKNRLHPSDYYSFGLYRPDLSRAKKNQFLGLRSNRALNMRLSPLALRNYSSLLDDKLLCNQLLKSCGFSVTQNKAVYAEKQTYGFLKTLKSAKDIKAFITKKTNLPLFAKPVHSSRALGAVSIISCSDDKTIVTLGDGRQVSAQQLADEIVAQFADGYLFQELLASPAAIEAILGKPIGGLRLVTLQSKNGPQVLYAAWRLPDPKLMHDSARTSVGTIAFVDVSSGKVLRVNRWKYYYGRVKPEGEIKSGALVGTTVPDWEICKKLATDVHGMFPDHGLLGWDIAVTTRGPVINEINTNPLHLIYQSATDRGLLNSDIKPRLDQAMAEVQRKLALQKAKTKAGQISGLNRRA